MTMVVEMSATNINIMTLSSCNDFVAIIKPEERKDNGLKSFLWRIFLSNETWVLRNENEQRAFVFSRK